MEKNYRTQPEDEPKITDGIEPIELEGQTMPSPRQLLSAAQKDGGSLVAGEIYECTWQWLAKRNCAHLVATQLLERYSMSVARWIQCEEAINQYGFLAKHPTSGRAISSPYVVMSQAFVRQINRLWKDIYQIVKDNGMANMPGDNPQEEYIKMHQVSFLQNETCD